MINTIIIIIMLCLIILYFLYDLYYYMIYIIISFSSEFFYKINDRIFVLNPVLQQLGILFKSRKYNKTVVFFFRINWIIPINFHWFFVPPERKKALTHTESFNLKSIKNLLFPLFYTSIFFS